MIYKVVPNVTAEDAAAAFTKLPGAEPFNLSVTFDTSSARPYINIALSGEACKDREQMRVLQKFLVNATGEKTPTHVCLSIGLKPYYQLKVFPSYDMTTRQYVNAALKKAGQPALPAPVSRPLQLEQQPQIEKPSVEALSYVA